MINLSDLDIQNTIVFLNKAVITGEESDTLTALKQKYGLILDELAKPPESRKLGPGDNEEGERE